jgi:hypothetical protein
MTHPIREILNGCADIVDQRGQPYGGIEDSFADAATIASVLTGKKLDARDIALVLHAVKLVRLAGNPAHDDSYDDGINYLAFAKLLRAPEAVAGVPAPPVTGATSTGVWVGANPKSNPLPRQPDEGHQHSADAPTDWSQFDDSINGAKATA